MSATAVAAPSERARCDLNKTSYPLGDCGAANLGQGHSQPEIHKRLLSLAGPGAFAQFPEHDLAFHAVFALNCPGVDDGQILALRIDLDREGNVGGFDSPGQRAFSELTLVSASQLLSFLLECKAWIPGACRSFDGDAPLAGDVRAARLGH